MFHANYLDAVCQHGESWAMFAVEKESGIRRRIRYAQLRMAENSIKKKKSVFSHTFSKRCTVVNHPLADAHGVKVTCKLELPIH